MTSEQLIYEGRILERPCTFLRPQVNGPVAAIWHDPDEEEVETTGYHCLLTINAEYIPSLSPSITGYISVFVNEEECQGGRIEVTPYWPKRSGTELYAHTASVLPPIDAVLAKGSEAVGKWLHSHDWQRTERYNDNFKDAPIVAQYERLWMREFPIYFESDIYAMLGGWHWPCADDDWHDLIEEQLLLMTLHDSEPWVEAWHTRDDQFKVIQRRT
jgi:hypothetical protein